MFIIAKIGFILQIIILFLSCRRNESVTPLTDNKVVIAISNDMESINPLLSSDVETSKVHYEIWEPLNQLHPVTHELMPVLASLPEVSTDHLSYTYHINPNARFSDGTPVTAKDVIFTFKTIKNIEVPSEWRRAMFTDLDSAQSPTPLTVTMYFLKPKVNREYDIINIPIIPMHCFDTSNREYIME